MGLAVAQIRCIYLGLYKSDLEYKIMTITQTKMGLASTMSDLLNTGSDLDPNSPEVKQLEQRRQKLQLVEKRLDAQMAMYNTKLQMVSQEIQSAKAMMQEGIKSSFSYGGGGH